MSFLKTASFEQSEKATQSSFADLVAKAKELEATGDLKEAARIYLQCLKQRPLNEFCYTRLMILYRKQKMYSKEALIIRKGIGAFEKLLNAKASTSSKVAAISKTLLKLTGLADAKGKPTFNFQPVEKWKQRLAVLQKRQWV